MIKFFTRKIPRLNFIKIHFHNAKKFYSGSENPMDNINDNYFDNFPSLSITKTFDLISLIQSREFIQANYFIMQERYDEAEEILDNIKNYLREEHLATHTY